LSVLSELKSRGVQDVCIVCCDGLTGLPDAIGVIWPRATVQLCVVHLIRASLRYASKKDWTPLTQSLRPIYTAVDETAAAAELEVFAERWNTRYPAIVRLWRTHWAEFVPFLAFPAEVRRVIYTTNLIESMNARLRKGDPQPGTVPHRAIGAQGAVSGGAEPSGLPPAQRRSSKLRLEAGAASVHNPFRGTNPHIMTATTSYTIGLTHPPARHPMALRVKRLR